MGIFFIVVAVSLMEPVYSVLEGGDVEVCFQLLGILGRDVVILPSVMTQTSDSAEGSC